MPKDKIVFVAYVDQENLGVGYLSSILLSTKTSSDVETVDFRLSNEEIYQIIKRADPLMVGFSLIFQYHTFQLRDLTEYLRENGVQCHFTVGGHYPSFRYESVLDVIPSIDSVVRFEGEFTICELAECLKSSKDWTKIKGIAYRRNGTAVSNELRPLIKDLDILPFPLHDNKHSYTCMKKNCAFMIASRGCVRNCSFCSIRKFYQLPPGRLRRVRSPSNVIQEVKELYDKHDVRIFVFQDDDFIQGSPGKNWILEFVKELEKEGLDDKILWKINCRTDEVEYDLFEQLKKSGLFLVYLGIESGNKKGLEFLNKQLNVEDNLRAVSILNELQVLYEYGFMLFDPSSTFDSVMENVQFLRKMCGDGSSPVVFCKTLPYAETEIESRLVKEGRLKGSIINPNYDLLDPRLENLCEFLHRKLYQQLFTPAGLSAVLNNNRTELTVLEKFYPHAKAISQYKETLRKTIASYNSLVLDIIEDTAEIFESELYPPTNLLDDMNDQWFKDFKDIYSKLYQGMDEFQKMQVS